MDMEKLSLLELRIDELGDVAFGLNYAQGFDLNVDMHSIDVDNVDMHSIDVDNVAPPKL